ncbi:unnamed protein product [Adineta steineri]|uniref:ETS domain-containing protein n=1 Tax=Adineta steineri TaxID=433720 RepID=A0A815VPG3_9BILA|nr:unnamed protein product [Adineta steineri]CAF1655052.1 unnamed protein product [Adineta steineri]
MSSSQYISQSSWDLGVYLPGQLAFENTEFQSPEALIQAFNTDLVLSTHREELESFNPLCDDMNAVSMLVDDDIFLSPYSDSDDTTYFSEQCTVASYVPNLSNILLQNVSSPLSPSSKDLRKKQKKSTSSSNSPTHFNHMYGKCFSIFDNVMGRKRRPYLFEFCRLVLDNEEYSHLAQYIDRKQGIFKINNPTEIAELWKCVKGRNSDTPMTYDKVARALRYYYSSGVMHPSSGRYTFRFGPKSGFGTTWSPVY